MLLGVGFLILMLGVWEEGGGRGEGRGGEIGLVEERVSSEACRWPYD